MKLDVPVMAELANQNNKPEYLYWVGCAGAYDERYKKVTRAFAKVLIHLGVDFAVLGKEESCTGDPAKRAGNEMLFQMQALQNIEILNEYGVRKIVCTCPHCFNILKNEYPALGGKYEVFHYTQFFEKLIDDGILQLEKSILKDERITFHDPCYLGRGNDEYNAPRNVIGRVSTDYTEMRRCKESALCCGAGGAQMFKETEKGNQEVYAERTADVIDSKASILATACPFCMTMLTDGIKYADKTEEIKNYDIAELVAIALEIE